MIEVQRVDSTRSQVVPQIEIRRQHGERRVCQANYSSIGEAQPGERQFAAGIGAGYKSLVDHFDRALEYFKTPCSCFSFEVPRKVADFRQDIRGRYDSREMVKDLNQGIEIGALEH